LPPNNSRIAAYLGSPAAYCRIFARPLRYEPRPGRWKSRPEPGWPCASTPAPLVPPSCLAVASGRRRKLPATADGPDSDSIVKEPCFALRAKIANRKSKIPGLPPRPTTTSTKDSTPNRFFVKSAKPVVVS
jgi:hypothetical protein